MSLSPDSLPIADRRSGRWISPAGRLAWYLALIGVAGLLPLLFAPVGPDYYSHRLYKALWDLGHLLFFALAAYILVRGLRGRIRLSGPGWILLLSAGALLAGALVELIQFQIGRSISGRDLFNDVVGAYLVGVLYPPIRRELALGLRWFLQAGLVILLGAVVAPLATLTYDHYLAVRQFPLLASFEHPTELSRWKGGDYERVALYPAHGNQALRIRFQGKGYEGVSLSHFPGNWRGFQFLELSIYNEGEALKATLRIHDEAHVRGDMAYSDRYNLHFALEPGWNHLRVPLQAVAQAPATRQMQMDQVRNLGLFVHNLGRSATIYLDHVRLASE